MRVTLLRMPGPYVSMATFCEKVLQERDGVLSVIRAVERVLVTINAPGAPAELPEGGVYTTTLLVALKSDDAQGRHPITIRAQKPDGTNLPNQSFDVMFEQGERGVNLILEMGLPMIEGLYWFDVLVSDVLLTRVPLRIMYQRMPGMP